MSNYIKKASKNKESWVPAVSKSYKYVIIILHSKKDIIYYMLL